MPQSQGDVPTPRAVHPQATLARHQGVLLAKSANKNFAKILLQLKHYLYFILFYFSGNLSSLLPAVVTTNASTSVL